jgi:hypothetical protein
MVRRVDLGNKEELEKVQVKAVKLVAGLKGETYEKMCRQLRSETLKEKRAKQDLMLVHKFVGGSITEGDQLFKKTDEPDRLKTRQTVDLTARWPSTQGLTPESSPLS